LSHGPADTGAAGSLTFASDGSVLAGEKFRQAEAAWHLGLAAVARAGTGVIVDDVFLDGRESQDRLETALEGLSVFWVGVLCQPAVAEARELRRADRVRGMARQQVERVHDGVRYDLVVDTTETASAQCARTIVAHLAHAALSPTPESGGATAS
jgi:chloramphenicol 3-O phosphotransferase